MSGELQVLVCQFCGTAVADTDAARAAWLVDRHRYYDGVYVVRCPAHISEWAMRNTVTGRTNQARHKAAAGRSQPVSGIARRLIPTGSRFQGAAGHKPEPTEPTTEEDQ